ncbi:hypothetical protein SEA_FAYELY_81 [Mycobacterium phage Fayely]|uniref:hypothetical protein n=1 Tax=Mycobacterium phage Pioneer TaxID=1698417 RepID=UPI0006BD9C2D|nr:hypothetical protein AVV05_gp026 [Mycobacterium phage Pioneer]AVI04171.1 hypothetical protein SEA_PHONNEGUT_83 [Mycobacterium phage Phonnegut]AVI04379.1 hypothetical protein SEA_SCHERZO_81 [Mycobacterium phage Scherzo]QGH78084.1 hypothetical protein SEA_LONEWOLF_83 [Mycobacterium phage LoneWolf]QGJ88733.1 hypothetical protein SEA_BEEMO_83 [Mycobacterium phage Beemo]UVF60943.1 hypothetical protein SEA_FAYELY_81 [Mycobacterium phage Fayely]
MARSLITSRPAEPAVDGSVVRFSREDWGDYLYAAIRVGGYWYVTQSKLSRHSEKDWEHFLDWLGEENWSTLELME